ncbi:MAG: hypothetical protein PHE79_11975 [Eubacteriales bacterium]|nr:hypothetical protein [Eubacteriales bacterium]
MRTVSRRPSDKPITIKTEIEVQVKGAPVWVNVYVSPQFKAHLFAARM